MLIFKHWIRNFYFLRLDFSVLTNSVAIIFFFVHVAEFNPCYQTTDGNRTFCQEIAIYVTVLNDHHYVNYNEQCSILI